MGSSLERMGQEGELMEEKQGEGEVQEQEHEQEQGQEQGQGQEQASSVRELYSRHFLAAPYLAQYYTQIDCEEGFFLTQLHNFFQERLQADAGNETKVRWR